MGLRFRKSIKLGKFFRLNINKKSVGLTTGVKGAHFTVNSKGRKTKSVGIPGTGLSYTSTSSTNNKVRKPTNHTANNAVRRNVGTTRAQKPQSKSTKVLKYILITLTGIIIFAIICGIIGSIVGSDTKLKLSLKWQEDKTTIATKYADTIDLNIDGDKSADEIDSSKFEIILSDKSICSVKFDSATTLSAMFSVKPLKDGKTTVKVKYGDNVSNTATITVDAGLSAKTTTKKVTTKKEVATKVTTKATTTKTATETTTKETTQQDDEKEIVYVTPKGKSYHSKNCQFYNEKTCTPMSKKDAKAAGYKACKVCGG